MRRLALFASISALVLAVLPLVPAQAVSEAAAGAIPGSYIVVLNEGEPGAVAAEHSRRYNSSVTHVYRDALRGYAARMSEQAAANVARDRRVAYVEQDGVVTTADVGSWGLDRIDQDDLPLSGTFTPAGDGAGVRAYVLDTGIRRHEEFGTRLVDGYTAINDGRGTDDCQGHGTHVAGTIGGVTYGVAKSVTLVPVRVLNCRGSGSWSGVIAGIDWVTNDWKTGAWRTTDYRLTGAVANMSLTGGYSDLVNNAVTNSVGAGVVYALAAGNNSADACKYSPASTPAALTVGATTSSDVQASYSNYGTCVDLLAPGSSITSANYTGGSSTKSGTSMAAPHVAGAAALLLGNGATAPQASTAVVADATPSTLTVQGAGTPNLLLYTAPTPPNAPSGLGATAASSSSIDLAWTDGSGNEDGFRVYQSLTGADGSWTRIANLAADAVEFTATGLTASTPYYYKVSAHNTGGEAFSDAASATTHAAPPIELTASNGQKFKGTTPVTLRWSGTTATVDVFRNGAVVARVAGSEYTDSIKGGGTFTYKVCEVVTTTCSNEAPVSF